MSQDEVSQHFDLNSKDYEEKMGTGNHGMMHYGDHSEYDRGPLESLLRKLTLTSRSETQESVVQRAASLAEKADIREDDTVVDAGCGRGGNALWIAENTGAEVIGLDIDSEHLYEARQKAEEQDLADRTEFVQGSFDDLPLEDFDVYFAIESQCYSQDEEEMLQQVHEALNPGGRTIISDGFKTADLTLEQERRMNLTHKGWGVDYLAHVEDFEDYMDEAGFENINVDNIEDEVWPTAQYLHRLSVPSIPYLEARKMLASGEKKQRYEQVRDLATTARHQYLTMKDGLWTQFDFYGEK